MKKQTFFSSFIFKVSFVLLIFICSGSCQQDDIVSDLIESTSTTQTKCNWSLEENGANRLNPYHDGKTTMEVLNFEDINLYEIRKKSFDAEKNYWNEFFKTSMSVNSNNIGRVNDCNCSYEILDVDIELSDEDNDIEIDFYSTNSCDENDVDACSYFSALYFSGVTCGSFDNEECEDFWPQLIPQYPRPFNCTIPSYSYFSVVLNASEYFGLCNPVDYTPVNLTFRIICTETCDNISFPSYSDPFTLIWDSTGGWADGDHRTAISLEGCGCEPFLTE